MPKEINLDLNKVELRVFEREVYDVIVDNMIKDIEVGNEFPPVPVYRIGENCYCLTPGLRDERGFVEGGHHRAVAHYIANKPLRCRLVYGKKIVKRIRRIANFPVGETRIADYKELTEKYSLGFAKHQI